MNRFSFLLFLVFILPGCSWIGGLFSGDESIEQPAELTEIVPQVSIEKLWDVNIGEGSGERALRLVPVLDQIREKLLVVNPKGRLQAFRFADGENLWETELETIISAGPGLGEGLILLGTANAEVLALEEKSGELKWRTQVTSEVLSIPEIARGIAVVRTVDGRVTGHDANNGKRLWIYNRSVPALTLRGTSSPVISGNSVLIGFDNGILDSISLHQGKLNWETYISEPRGRTELERMVDLDSTPIIADGVVYSGAYQGRIAALSLKSGRIGWSRSLSSYAGFGYDGRQLLVTDEFSQVWALDKRNGASLWKQDKLRARALTAPVTAGKFIVTGDFDGYLHWMARDDGRLIGRVRAGSDAISAAPIVDKNRVAVLDVDGKLSVFSFQALTDKSK